MVQKRYCDKCHVEIQADLGAKLILNNELRMLGTESYFEYDLCSACFSKVVDVVKQFMASR